MCHASRYILKLPLELTISSAFLKFLCLGWGGQASLGRKSHPRSGISHQGTFPSFSFRGGRRKVPS